MANPTLASGYPPISCGVSYDFSIPFHGHPNDYTTAMEQQQAIKMPLGSQFNLLSSENLTSMYSATRVPQVSTSSLDRITMGYNTFVPTSSVDARGGYTYYGRAYGFT